jgi:hypothetical protein
VRQEQGARTGTIPSLALYIRAAAVYFFIPHDRQYADLFLLPPATWASKSVLAFSGRETSISYFSAFGGIVLLLAMIAAAAHCIGRRD